MRYDFDRLIDRRHTGSMKWEEAEGALPLWVADMDLETFPGVREAIARRAAHGIYGYTVLSEGWYQAYQNWWKTRHSFEIRKEWLVFVTGVIPAISSAVRKLTTPGENVLIQTPVYPIFFNSILNNGRRVRENRLLYDPDERTYRIDWEDLEAGLEDPQTTLMILCNPHNPTGNLWDRETLGRIGDLCLKHHVKILSDEIHCDLTAPGAEYVPFASVSETNRRISVTCVAPTKAFNLAGIQTAAVIVPDPDLRHKMWRRINTDEVGEGNCFSVTAVEAALTAEGGEWLDALRAYLWENRKTAEQWICDRMPSVKTIPSRATYLLWADCSGITDDSDRLVAWLQETAKVKFSSGAEFGGNGSAFIRINLACPRSLLLEGLRRFAEGTACL